MTTLTREELLVILAEEAGEVTQAATKCLRFGYERHQPDYGINCEVLAQEVGDLLGIADALRLDPSIIAKHRAAKVAKAERVKAELCPTPTGDRLTSNGAPK